MEEEKNNHKVLADEKILFRGKENSDQKFEKKVEENSEREDNNSKVSEKRSNLTSNKKN